MLSSMYMYVCMYVLIVFSPRYQDALSAKKERATKAMASYGPKSKQFVNPKEVCVFLVDHQCVHILCCLLSVMNF